MSDKPAEKTEKVEKKEKKVKEEAPVAFTPKATSKSSNWSLEKCQKIAKRFASAKEWEHGAPASYKSAVHHHWIAQCMPTARKNKVA